MRDEPARMGAGEDDGLDVVIAVCAIDQRVELLGDVVPEQPERATVDACYQHRPSVLDLEVSPHFCCHDCPYDGRSRAICLTRITKLF
ncbi:MAG: hypothetical protein WAW85_12100 [Gordonia sp. (in: high G+C Gram-positive bacteria)]|uniref:hypothetical protein n=1 Tax=Gordonia sp. (in: high G+C Gram-positive bacteria) TaxID=84139 RepID=UPI003BB59F16